MTLSAAAVAARAPVRISLAGEATGLDPYPVPFGGFSVTAAINRYCYVAASLPPDGGIHVFADSCRECEPHIASARDGESQRLAEAVIERFRDTGLENRGVELYLTTDVPPGSGLGCSSALSVALVRALSIYLNVPMDTEAVADLATSVALTCLGPSIGTQDPYASAYGGINAVVTGASGTKVRLLDLSQDVRRRLVEELMLFWIGRSTDPTKIARSQMASTGPGPLTTRSLHELKALAEETRQSLVDGDLGLFGRLLDMSWHVKKRLFPGVSNDRADACYERAMQAGAVGGKVTGGGGGFLLLYAPGEMHASVRAAMQEAGLREMPFELDDEGERILSEPEWNGDRDRLEQESLTRRQSIERPGAGALLPSM